MTTFNNFNSKNGRILPNSGRGMFFGPEEYCNFYYVDENGDVWVPPCSPFSHMATGPSGPPTGPAEPTGATGGPQNPEEVVTSICVDDASPGGRSSNCVNDRDCTIEVNYATEPGTFIFVNYPEYLLRYQPISQTVTGPPGGAPGGSNQFVRANLTDSNLGNRAIFRKENMSGNVRLYFNHMNATNRRIETTLEAGTSAIAFDGIALNYALIFRNDNAAATQLRITRWGGSMGNDTNNLTLRRYFEYDADQGAVDMGNGGRGIFNIPGNGGQLNLFFARWTAPRNTAGPAGLFLNPNFALAIPPGMWFEGLADFTLSSPCNVSCWAFTAGTSPPGTARMWPVIRGVNNPADYNKTTYTETRPMGSHSMTTGVAPNIGLRGNFTCTLTDASAQGWVYIPAQVNGECKQGWITHAPLAWTQIPRRAVNGCNMTAIPNTTQLAYDANRFGVVGSDIQEFDVAVCGSCPAYQKTDNCDALRTEQMLFTTNLNQPFATEKRNGTNFGNLANWGFIYHHMFTIRNAGTIRRRVTYFVDRLGASNKSVVIFNRITRRVTNYPANIFNQGGSLRMAACVDIPPGTTRVIDVEIAIQTGDAGIGHQLFVNNDQHPGWVTGMAPLCPTGFGEPPVG